MHTAIRVCNFSIRVTAVLEYFESAFHLPGSMSLFLNTAKQTNNGVCHCGRRGGLGARSLLINRDHV